MSRRTSAITALAAAALALTACSSSTGATRPPATHSAVPVTTVQAATKLTVGQTYRYPDGLKVSVTALKTITSFGQYDSKPSADEIAFRVYLTITNSTRVPQDLDHLPVSPEGATNGGDTTILINNEDKDLSGQLAPGNTAVGSSSFSIAKSHGKKIAVGVYRGGLTANPATVPTFTGTIQ